MDGACCSLGGRWILYVHVGVVFDQGLMPFHQGIWMWMYNTVSRISVPRNLHSLIHTDCALAHDLTLYKDEG